MASPDATPSSNSLITIKDATNPALVLCTKSVNMTSSWEEQESTTLCDAEVKKVPTKRNFAISGDYYVYDAAASPSQDLLRATHEIASSGTVAAKVQITFFPLGNNTGDFSYQTDMYVTQLDISSDNGGLVEGSFALSNGGAIVYTSPLP